MLTRRHERIIDCISLLAWSYAIAGPGFVEASATSSPLPEEAAPIDGGSFAFAESIDSLTFFGPYKSAWALVDIFLGRHARSENIPSASAFLGDSMFDELAEHWIVPIVPGEPMTLRLSAAAESPIGCCTGGLFWSVASVVVYGLLSWTAPERACRCPVFRYLRNRAPSTHYTRINLLPAIVTPEPATWLLTGLALVVLGRRSTFKREPAG